MRGEEGEAREKDRKEKNKRVRRVEGRGEEEWNICLLYYK